MTMAHLVLFFLACGAATFPLTLMAVRYAASLSPASAFSQRMKRAPALIAVTALSRAWASLGLPRVTPRA